MAHSFGTASMKQYETLHNDLQLVLDHTILKCAVDFSLVEGHRSPEKQLEYFKKGRKQRPDGSWVIVSKKDVITHVDGYKVKGKHNYYPSLAVDIAVYIPNKPKLAYDISHLTYIAGCMMTIADQLFEEGKIKHRIRWGGNWKGEGDFTNTTLFDGPHFEIVD